MAEKEEKTKQEKPAKKPYNPNEKKVDEERLIRILAKDIPGNMKVYVGLTRIKGISWSMSNAICKILKIPKNKKIIELSQQEIEKISEFAKKPSVPKYLINRPNDMESGENRHLIGNDLELQTEFDIKRLKKIKSYRGYRHLNQQPSRGQKTRSHFRRNKSKGVGIKKKKASKEKEI
ncbi:30S ribosomal protein S13 [uncultured archaeon]|nr:30S ribosomal protein S13 [uncultured archaeon]